MTFIATARLIRRKQDNKVILIDFGAVKQIGVQVVNAEGETKKLWKNLECDRVHSFK
ncbi:MAG: hypothetical protein AAF378_01910 [Cyanobacteria bacterium P01_A01_bin.84]